MKIVKMDFELNNELEGFKRDKERYKIELDNEKKKMEFLLKNEMGQDIKNVINGKKKVRLPFYTRFKYKINYYLNNIFNAI